MRAANQSPGTPEPAPLESGPVQRLALQRGEAGRFLLTRIHTLHIHPAVGLMAFGDNIAVQLEASPAPPGAKAGVRQHLRIVQETP